LFVEKFLSRSFGIGLGGGVRRAGRALLDAILPPLCLRCRVPVAEPQSVCAACWTGIRFLVAPWCAQCGIPFPHALGPQVRCGACLARERPFVRLRSAIAYDDGSRDLVLGFKHADRQEACPLFVRWMLGVARPELEEADLVVPVPLHWRRLLMRRYNQAGLLAHGIAAGSKVPVRADLLVRERATESQGAMLSARARLKNVANVFRVPPTAVKAVTGRRVVIVDDVLTTGATITACAKALRRAGAGSVSVVTLARVVRPLAH
jgi:ComF family protein